MGTMSYLPGALYFADADAGKKICDIEAVPEFEPETTDPDTDATTEYVNLINGDIALSCVIRPFYRKRLERIVYNWHCSGPIRKQALWKELIKKYTWRET